MEEKTKKIPALFGFLIAAILIALTMPVLQLVLGFTDPTGDPPTGGGLLRESSGNVSISNARLVDLDTPVAGTDAANKDYVLAQTGVGGGSGNLVTLFGVSADDPTPQSVYRAGGTVAACLRGVTSPSCVGAPVAVTDPGFGTPDCSILDTESRTWSELYAGYGPMNTMFMWYGAAFNPRSLVWPPEEQTGPDQVVIGTNSICSMDSFTVVRQPSFSEQSASFQTVENSSTILSACTTTDCNTCRVCIQD